MRTHYITIAILFISQLQSAIADDGVLFFEQNVRPVLVQHCFKCHSSQVEQKAGLVLDDRQGWLTGGENGPAVVPGNPDQSLVMQALKHTGDVDMPPAGRLPDEQIQAIEKWIALGAPFPATRSEPSAMSRRLQAAQSHWAFQPLSKTAPPIVKQTQWPRNDIDKFILAKLEERHWSPAAPAQPETLIRRVTLDLIGLPPSLEETRQFVSAPTPDAYEKLVDRLLASPHYGERWGRHWLDLARYADSSGFHNDLDRPWAWKYRDYVIHSFNEDKPYARFVAEQLAGDEVPAADQSSWIATGFGRNGPSNDDNMGKTEAALKQYRADQLDDILSTTSSVFLGITLGCARCHDHKTDPFPTEDYYSLIAIFNGTEEFGQKPTNTPPKTKDSAEVDQQQLMLARVERRSQVPVTYVMRRGNASSLGDEVQPAVPRVLASQPVQFPEPPAESKSSLRRLTFAGWITSPDNALTWRVLANRIWQHHFGRGLVATPSNFGFTGETPSHPELLDYLAGQLSQNGGHWKPLHKLIVMSATYQQASQGDLQNLQADPQNIWLSHMSLRRLEAEALRDSILAASGKLNRQLGGPGIKPQLPAELIPASQRNKWPLIKEEQPEHWRRSVYIYAKRQLLMPLMELFDAPTTTDSCAVRSQSVVPTQALVLMNDQFVESQAGFLAQRVQGQAAEGEQVQLMFQLTLGRLPSMQQLSQAEQFISQRRNASDPASALTDLAHVIFNSSEFLHIP